jgi:uncharacterized protein YndB with AHSA1/START domain
MAGNLLRPASRTTPPMVPRPVLSYHRLVSGFESRASISIDAEPDQVWAALTTPEIMKQWFFGTDTETDWSIGGPIVHRGEYESQPYVDKGIVLAFEPPHRLVHTHWSSVSGVPDAPENYQTVTWELAGADGGTDLTVTDANIRSAEARDTSDQGWAAALTALKELVES